MGNSPAWNPDPSTLKPIAAPPPAVSNWNPDPSTAKPIQQTQAPPIPSNATISAQPEPTGWGASISKWAENVSNDIKYGTDLTGVGTVLKKMGAHGVYNGNPQAVGDFMASLPLGLARATQGTGEVAQGQTWQGTKDIVGGAAQAATLPAAFMGAPSEAGADALTSGTSKLFGSVDRAGQLFDQVRTAAKDVPIEVTDEMYDALNKVQQLKAAGARGMPMAISRFFNRINNVDEELTWDEARRFYTNVSRLSGNEYNSMNPQMNRAVGQFASAFNDSLRGAAQSAGVADQYAQAMQLYAKAKGWQQFGSDVWTGMKKALPVAGGVGAGSLIGHKVSDILQGQP